MSCSWTRSSACLLKDLVSHPLDCLKDAVYQSASFGTSSPFATAPAVRPLLATSSVVVGRVYPATMLSFSTILLLGFVSLACAATVEVYWDITWVNAAPDGYSRPVIGINGVWPCPLLEANVGDTVIVHVDNKLGNETTGIHFHGINQKGTPEMDGPSATTQCSVPPGSSVTYQWLVYAPSQPSMRMDGIRLTLSNQADEPGTYWYHSHQMGQYPDGLRGPMVIHDPEDPYKNQVGEEVILTCTDW